MPVNTPEHTLKNKGSIPHHLKGLHITKLTAIYFHWPLLLWSGAWWFLDFFKMIICWRMYFGTDVLSILECPCEYLCSVSNCTETVVTTNCVRLTQQTWQHSWRKMNWLCFGSGPFGRSSAWTEMVAKRLDFIIVWSTNVLMEVAHHFQSRMSGLQI